jgi:galactosamine-6-phosphate isomerase
MRSDVEGFPVQVASDYDDLSRRATRLLIDELGAKPDLLLCAAAGTTPLGTYRYLAQERRNNPALFAKLRVLKLDEWGGLEKNDPASCEHCLREHLLEPLGISNERYIGFASQPDDPEVECHRMSAWLDRNGPIDLCILGLGMNGHIGFNEPGDALSPSAHVATLANESLRHPMLSAANAQPTFGLTLGMAEILAARKIVLLVSGAHKRPSLERLCRNEISTAFPASFLWLHRALICLCDGAAVGSP